MAEKKNSKSSAHEEKKADAHIDSATVALEEIPPKSEIVSESTSILNPKDSDERAKINNMFSNLQKMNSEGKVEGVISISKDASTESLAKGMKEGDTSILNKGYKIGDIEKTGLGAGFDVKLSDYPKDSILMKEKDGTFSVKSKEEFELDGKELLNENDPNFENKKKEMQEFLEEADKNSKMVQRSVGGVLAERSFNAAAKIATGAMNGISNLFSSNSSSKSNKTLPITKDDSLKILSEDVSKKAGVLTGSIDGFVAASDNLNSAFDDKNTDAEFMKKNMIERFSKVKKESLDSELKKQGYTKDQAERYKDYRVKSENLVKADGDYKEAKEKAIDAFGDDENNKTMTKETRDSLANSISDSDKLVNSKINNKDLKKKLEDDKDLSEKMRDMIDKIMGFFNDLGPSPKPK